jgi:hypothetical protein
MGLDGLMGLTSTMLLCSDPVSGVQSGLGDSKDKDLPAKETMIKIREKVRR